jgi:hypothetical protein
MKGLTGFGCWYVVQQPTPKPHALVSGDHLSIFHPLMGTTSVGHRLSPIASAYRESVETLDWVRSMCVRDVYYFALHTYFMRILWV